MQIKDQDPSIIEVIDRFPLTTSFVDWLSGGTYEFKVLEETSTHEQYSRTIQFSAKGQLIQIAKIDLSVAAIGKDFIQSFLQSKVPFGKYVALHPETNITKVWISNNLTDTQYVISSHICRNEKVCGTCWEAYELDNVQNLLEQKVC